MAEVVLNVHQLLVNMHQLGLESVLARAVGQHILVSLGLRGRGQTHDGLQPQDLGRGRHLVQDGLALHVHVAVLLLLAVVHTLLVGVVVGVGDAGVRLVAILVLALARGVGIVGVHDVGGDVDGVTSVLGQPVT